MTGVGRMALSIVFATATACAAAARAETTVEFTVVHPDGRPAANADVEVTPTGRYHPPFSIERSGKRVTTDDEGTARHVLAEATDRLRVSLPGVGIAVTDVFDSETPGKITVGLPRLVPFGSIKGVLPEGMRGDGVTLDPQAYLSSGRRSAEPLSIGPDGRFVFTGLGPGRYILQPKRDGKPLDVVANVTLSPGENETVAPESFHPDPQRPRAPATPKTPPAAAPVKPAESSTDAWPFAAMVWYAGTVRDGKGQPIGGAKIFAHGSNYGGIRSSEVVLATETDYQGRWEIRSVNRQHQFTGGGLLIAHVRERPLAFATCRANESWLGEAKLLEEPERHDLVLPERSGGGMLRVRVLQEDGQPAAKASVVVTRGAGREAFFSFNRMHSAARTALDEVVRPMVATDEQGRAHFSDLTPGLYALVTCEGPTTARDLAEGGGWHMESPPAEARCYGVPVRAGEAPEYVVQLGRQRSAIPLELHNVDGRPVADKKPALELKRPNDQGGGTQSLELDAGGRGSIPAYMAGLFEARIRFKDGPLRSHPVRNGPFYEAVAVVANSPLLKDFPPVILTAGYRRPGSVLVKMRDVAGRPARGYVRSNANFGETASVGGTEDDGTLVWRNLVEGRYSFNAYLPGVEAPACRESSPFADDESLVGLKLLLQQAAEVGDGRATTVTFEPRPVGYVRGRVRPAAGQSGSDYRLPDPDGWHANLQYRTYYDAATGDFLLGPLPVGKTKLTLLDLNAKSDRAARVVENVEVRDDRVTFVELTPAEVKDDARAQLLAQWGTGPAARLRSGRVVAPDGETAAADAQLYTFRRDGKYLQRLAVADSDGRFTYRLERLLLDSGDDEAGPLVVAAWLPGNFAPTIVPLPAANDDATELKIVLDAGCRLKGRVTIGGEPSDGLGNRLQVLLAADRDSPLNQILYEELTPSADGTFDVGGLAAGRYRVQAALDGIWLSTTKEFVAVADTTAEPIDLDVGRPGPPSVITCTDKNGKPAAGVSVTLRRPEGPLTKRLWPVNFKSDAGGTLHLPPLEVGTHVFRTPQSKLPYEVQIEPLPATGGAPHRQTILID